MLKGWFRIPGVQGGDRSLEEQLQGLAALAVKGKSVLDLGCAEGLIALEMRRAGAALVHGVELNPSLLEVARGMVPADDPAIGIFCGDLNLGLPEGCLPEYDVVLLLAILHKLAYPAKSLRVFAAAARERVVIRLPFGSKGVFISKFSQRRCDVNPVMIECGFRLEQTLPGPRRELVQHWRR